MTDFDLDRLGDVWRQQPDAAEMAALQRTAETVARRARQAQIADAALAILVSALVLILALTNAKPATMLLGGAAIALMLVSSIRQRRLRRLELESLSGGTEEMLEQSIARTKATIKRSRTGMLALPPAIVIGIGFGAALDDGTSGLVDRFGADPWMPLAAAAAIVAVIGAGLVHYLRAIRMNRGELARLETLRDAFRRDREANTE
jgi:hypothetical protein